MTAIAMIGASGVVGRVGLEKLLDLPEVSGVVALGRRPLSTTHTKLTNVAVDLHNPETLVGALSTPIDTAISAIGTTMKQAGSKEAFRRVDYDLVLNFARVALARNAKHFILVSSLGADPNAKTFYLKTKGEAERDLAALGFGAVTILRPSFIDDQGSRREDRPLEKWTLPLARLVFSQIGSKSRYAPVRADVIAQALVRVVLEKPSKALRILESEEIQKYGAP
jgi:uncharacterized protein YbjT (DUF2867 family)